MSLSESFYWHDYETSGADVSIDRPLQFAGIRTDREFNIIGKPLVIYNRPTPDFLPHPIATRITGISPYTALEHGLAERDFIGQIHHELSMPGTCGVGYNSLRFDDEVTRFALYRNFHDPYARERDQGRSRWDLIDATRAIYALRPTGIVWPKRDDGLTSFRLEELTAANGIDHGNAHDALSDVEATIGLAALLNKAQPALFDALYASRLKLHVADLLNVDAMKPVIYVSGVLGGARHNVTVIVPLAVSASNKNDVICADLSRAPDFLLEEPEAIKARLFARKDDLLEGQERPPLVTVRINRAPVILPMQWMTPEVAERLGYQGDRLREHLQQLREHRAVNPHAFRDFIQTIFTSREFAPRTDVDAMLYDGFFDRTDSHQFPSVVKATAEALRDQSWVFKDRRLPELLFRYRARNYPDSLLPEEAQQWREHCAAQRAPGGPFDREALLEGVSSELAEEGLSDRQRSALNDLERYIKESALSLSEQGNTELQ